MNYTCPHCNRDTTITDSDRIVDYVNLRIESGGLAKQFEIQYIVCPNVNCNKYTLTASLYDATLEHYGYYAPTGEALFMWNLVPSANIKVFPDYIPQPIIADYNEACLIKELSPKASATLARRCLQGMIRNFWSINKKSLYEEINAIQDKVDQLTWEAIDAVRSIGNIGAHMQKDINCMIDVHPGEAQLLIDLIETLLKEWYVNRHEREQKMQAIIELSKQKSALKAGQTE
ncbi:DUF4145 domain-containing protein [Paenibacillus sp. DMB20]|uniref:DUF4145 domain-containing protein n=1 Tax=Paenibacillus sp. DMB20 TaxID=1642570 RepID=UPI000627877C|nr:DUF4145 domain-containing protein [Paenibacillus sp. DMB20]KKO54516.1 hypothetical protein XI25_06995 [Paenibacillus sp. DMB20]